MNYSIEFLNVNDLKPYKKNAKKHSQKQIEQIAESIKNFGFKQNLVIDSNNVVIIGHGRLEAAKKIGLEKVPCIRANDLSEEQIKALRLIDNKVNESEWDNDLLKIELNDIININMKQFDFKLFDDKKNDDENDDEIKRKDLSDKFKLSMSVVIDCETEQQQQELYEEMLERGFSCRIE